MTNTYFGQVCVKHPGLNGERSNANRRCIGCKRETTQALRAANPDKANKQGRESNKKQRIENPERVRWHKIWQAYRIRPEQWQRMHDEQDGRCASCGAEFSNESMSARSPCIDHDHNTGRVRGLLCANCNKAEGLLKTSAAALALALYMDRHKCSSN